MVTWCSSQLKFPWALPHLVSCGAWPRWWFPRLEPQVRNQPIPMLLYKSVQDMNQFLGHKKIQPRSIRQAGVDVIHCIHHTFEGNLLTSTQKSKQQTEKQNYASHISALDNGLFAMCLLLTFCRLCAVIGWCGCLACLVFCQGCLESWCFGCL